MRISKLLQAAEPDKAGHFEEGIGGRENNSLHQKPANTR